MRPLTPDERAALQRELATIPAGDVRRAERKREILARHSVVATQFGLRRRH